MDLKKGKINEEVILDAFYCYCYWIDDLELFGRFESVFPDAYKNWISSEHFAGVAKSIIDRELEDIDGESISDYKSKLESVQNLYPIDFQEQLEKLEELEAEFERYVDHQVDMANDREFDDYPEEDISEDIAIQEIFNSLKE